MAATEETMLDPVTEARRKLLNRLRRLEGQVRGIQSMIASEKACEDVLTQITAAKSALNQVGLHSVSYAMRTCAAPAPDASSQEVIDATLRLFLEYARPSVDELPDDPTLAPAGEAAERAALLALLGSLESRVRLLQDLVADEAGCGPIFLELGRAKAELNRAGMQVIAHAMHTCLAPAEDADRDAVVDEALEVFIRYIGCVR
jgi:DNA-binding FrmR family transcriptional regulator